MKRRLLQVQLHNNFKRLFVAAAIIFTSITSFAGQGDVMIILQENTGKFAELPDGTPNNVQRALNAGVDALAENFEDIKATLVAQRYYSKVILLTDTKCTRAELLKALVAETKAGKKIDLYIFGHGSPEKLVLFNNKSLTGGSKGSIQSLITDARAQEGAAFNFNLRLVYMCNCFASTVNNDWVAIGAKASVGSKCVNYMAEPMITLFTHKFVKENKSVTVAARESFNEAKIYWAIPGAAAGYNEPGCDAKAFHKGQHCPNGNRFQTSEPEVAGAGTTRFNTSTGEKNIVQVVAREISKEAGDAADKATEAVENISFNINSLLSNVNGTAVPEGKYYIRLLKGRKYLDVSGSCADENGCKVQLWSLGQSKSNNIFDIKKQAVGYTIKSGGKFLEIDANTLMANNGRVQMWEANALGGHLPNQVWLFFKVADNKYVIRNVASLKVLDANDDCTGENGCRVKQYDGQSNDATQVWVLEKAN